MPSRWQADDLTPAIRASPANEQTKQTLSERTGYSLNDSNGFAGALHNATPGADF
jgi:hypothetical protein